MTTTAPTPSPTPATPSTLEELAGRFTGAVITPGDLEYDQARRIWNGDIDRRPLAVARCADEQDVVLAVRYAAAAGLEVSVRSGGHSFPGLSVADDALMVDLSRMRGVRSGDDDTLVVQGGCLLGDVDRYADSVGRAVPAGVVSHTGVAGLTLGGGYGYLSRRWALTCDALRSVRLVTADGQVVTADDETQPELMWGLRGGGGNFGIVTEFTYETYPLTHVLAGWILHPYDRATEFIDFYRSFAATMPRELCVLLRTKMSGRTAFLAPELKGDDKRYVGVLVVWSGSPEEGEEVLRPLREWAPAVHDDVRVQRYVDVQCSIDGGARHGVGRYERAGYLERIDMGMVTDILGRLEDPPSAECEISLFSLGGAIGDVAEDATAYSSRGAQFAFEVRTAWTDRAERSALVQWTRDAWTAIDAHAMEGVYVNLVMDEGGDRVRRLYGAEKFDRLSRLKAVWDPENLFHLNQNIPPAQG